MRVDVRPFTPGDDAELLERGLRPCDIREAMKVAGLSPARAVGISIINSDFVDTVRLDGKVAALLGAGGGWGGIGIPWLLAHQDFEHPAAAVPMARLVRRRMDRWVNVYGRLENYADPEHAAALRLLTWMGFRLMPSKIKGAFGDELVYFWRAGCAPAEGRGIRQNGNQGKEPGIHSPAGFASAKHPGPIGRVAQDARPAVI